jgi:uncharacterized protein (UPF0333 family)
MKAKNPVLITIILVIVVGAAAFFGGMQFQKSQRNSQFAGPAGMQGPNGTFRRSVGATNQNAQAIVGEILKSDDTSITVKSQDGSSKIILLSSSTAVNKQATGSKDDLKIGETVAVFGKSNSDGSITAQNVQLNPMNGQGGARFMMQVTPTPSK